MFRKTPKKVHQIYLNGQTPLTKLFTTSGSTETSAKAALEIAERKVMALQRFIKRSCEHETFTPLILQAEFEPKTANCRLNWGTEKPKHRIFALKKLEKLVKAGFELCESTSERR